MEDLKRINNILNETEDLLNEYEKLKAAYNKGFCNGYKAFANDLYWDIVASKRMGKPMTIDDLMSNLEHIFGDWKEEK